MEVAAVVAAEEAVAVAARQEAVAVAARHLLLHLFDHLGGDLVVVDDHLEELVPRRRLDGGVVVVLHVVGEYGVRENCAELRRIAQNCAALRGSAP